MADPIRVESTSADYRSVSPDVGRRGAGGGGGSCAGGVYAYAGAGLASPCGSPERWWAPTPCPWDSPGHTSPARCGSSPHESPSPRRKVQARGLSQADLQAQACLRLRDIFGPNGAEVALDAVAASPPPLWSPAFQPPSSPACLRGLPVQGIFHVVRPGASGDQTLAF
mmetsp:Transcript_48442/g.155513  ORF Transcript_48442/g.155513 Transcript_48442/m.155513 type:complete len:168 (+) Transcript_48442:1-504(+)